MKSKTEKRLVETNWNNSLSFIRYEDIIRGEEPERKLDGLLYTGYSCLDLWEMLKIYDDEKRT